MFAAVGVTAQAVGKIGDAIFPMFGGHLGLVVAGVAGPLVKRRLMTIGAAITTLTMIHGEGMRPGILRGRPAVGGVANRTFLTREHARVQSGFAVASGTLRRRTLVDVVFVAIRAGDVGMLTIKFESRKVVVKRGRFPSLGRMAGTTFRTELAVVSVIF